MSTSGGDRPLGMLAVRKKVMGPVCGAVPTGKIMNRSLKKLRKNGTVAVGRGSFWPAKHGSPSSLLPDSLGTRRRWWWMILERKRCFFGCRERGAGQDQVQPEETQAEPEAEDAFHHATIARAREEVHRKAIPERRGEGRVLLLPAPHRDPGEIALPSFFFPRSSFIGRRIYISNTFLIFNAKPTTRGPFLKFPSEFI